MYGCTRFVRGAAVVVLPIALTGVVSWAQEPPRPQPKRVAVPAPSVPAPPARVLPLCTTPPQAVQPAPHLTVRPLVIPTPPSGGFGIVSSGTAGGGRFFDADGGAEAWLGGADFGVQAFGNAGGGYFRDADNSGYAYVGYGNSGIQAWGSYVGGFFDNTAASGWAEVGYGDLGIMAYGNDAGGYFVDGNSSGQAWIGRSDRGIEALGNDAGGYFEDSDHSGYAWVARGDRGIEGYGNEMGGYFKDLDHSGYAYVGYVDTGISAYGNNGGGYFQDLNSSGWTYVGSSTSKVLGNGSLGFVQNHPADPGAVVVYAAPEGDEVATYTRGTARLVGGEARVPLGETFKWVTNPDLGLTAHVTPRGDCRGVYVASLTTEEMVVKELGGGTSDATFDYLVYGLRIGFEETTAVQEKQRESFIPSMKDHRELLARRPDLARYTALARFGAQREAMGITEPLKLDRANALKAAIHEFDPAVDKVEVPRPPEIAGRPGQPAQEGAGPRAAMTAHSTSPHPDLVRSEGPAPALAAVAGDETQDLQARSFSSPREQLATRMAVAGNVEPGDVLVVDREHPDLFARGERAADPTVVGVVVADAGVALGAQRGEGSSAPVALSGIARCKVDASFGAILPGDLLVSSPTPGHAMREASPLPGTVVGKALEPFASGQGTIRILVTLR